MATSHCSGPSSAANPPLGGNETADTSAGAAGAATRHYCPRCGHSGDYAGAGPHQCPGCGEALRQVGTQGAAGAARHLESAETPNLEDPQAIFDAVMACKALLTLEQRQQFQGRIVQEEEFVVPWNIVAWLASQDGSFFKELSQSREKAKVLLPAVDDLRDFAAFLHATADLAETVALRVVIAGCAHEEANEWMVSDETAEQTS